MSNPNRVKVYYQYQCGRYRQKQLRGSSAKYCENPKCKGPLYCCGRNAQTKLKVVA